MAGATGRGPGADFQKLWVGQTISEFGSYITSTALPFIAFLTLGATPLQLGLLVACGSVPVLLVGLPAGVWVDRVRRRPLLIAADLGRAAILLTVPLAAVLGVLRIEQLYVVAALAGGLSVVFEVAYHTMVPTLVGRDELVAANSKLGVSSSLAEIGGPAIAGLLVQVIQAPLTILGDAFSFLVSAGSLAAIRQPEPPPPPVDDHQPILHEIGAGLRLVLGHPLLRPLTAAAASAAFFGNFIGTLYSIYAVRELGLPPAIVGVLIGVGGIGALAGALLVGRLTRWWGVGPTIIRASVFAGLIQFLLPIAGGPAWLAASILFTGQIVGDVAWAVRAITEQSLQQAVIPDRLLGRANASLRFLVGGLSPLGAITGGLLGETIGIRPTLLLAVLGILAGTLWLVFSPLRALRTVSAADETPAQ